MSPNAQTVSTVQIGVGRYTAKHIAGKMVCHTYAALAVAQVERCVFVQQVSEASFLQQIKALAYLHGWAFHHSTPSLTSKGKWITTGSPGFPDLVLAHRARGLIFAELKSAKGKPTDLQLDWMARVGPYAECYLWRPDDLSAIEHRLSQC